jgi:glyoxylase-like metal-dependent hydrolase (beta-lactamase superfamily II)
MILEKIVVGPIETNCYILGSALTHEAFVIDPGAEAEEIKSCLRKHQLKIKAVVNTHGHLDHIGADASMDAPVYIHRLDAEFLTNPDLNLGRMFGFALPTIKPDLLLEDGEKIKAGEICLEVIHTPGHTPGGICLHSDNICFTGDTLFAEGVGRTDIPSANEKDLLAAIHKRLLMLPDEVTIYPGHGPSSTIGQARKDNPFL